MNSILIIITSAFPYQQGEEFILNEIPFYAPFEKVYFVPIGATDFSKKKIIDESITVYQPKTIAPANVLSKLVGSIKMLWKEDAKNELQVIKATKRSGFYSFRRALVECYKVDSLRNEILEFVGTIRNNNPNCGIVLYSYWMGNHAKIAVDVKKRFPDIKIVTRCHGGDLYEYRYKSNYIPFRTEILMHENMIFTISENGKSYLEKTDYEINAPIVVSRLGTIQKYDRCKITNKDGINIVSCSYCRPLKRIDLIIDALAKMNEKSISWTHIGNGPEYERLIQKSKDCIPQNIEFSFIGYADNTKIQELYSSGAFNLFVNVSEAEGIPVSIMEAMSYGLPVIATDVGGVSEMIKNGESGYLLSKDFRLDELRDAIRTILQMSESDFQTMSKKSYQLWLERFDANRNYSEFIDTLKQM